MELLNNEIKKKIQNNIINVILQKKYNLAIKNISNIIDELYANIPDNKRISYGNYYVIKTLGEYIYKQLEKEKAQIFTIGTTIFNLLDDIKDHKCKGVILQMLSYYGIYDYKKVLPLFEIAASSEHWEMREFAAGFFPKIIKEHPEYAKAFLLKLTKSNNPHLRRFVSETLRPARENKWFYKDPDYPLSILRKLFKESNHYPRTSVGNNLSDLARQLPELVYDLVKELVDNEDKNSDWIAYRACRNLVKKDPVKVMDLLKVDEYKYKKRIHRRREV